jgi:hypothetical protein
MRATGPRGCARDEPSLFGACQTGQRRRLQRRLKRTCVALPSWVTREPEEAASDAASGGAREAPCVLRSWQHHQPVSTTHQRKEPTVDRSSVSSRPIDLASRSEEGDADRALRRVVTHAIADAGKPGGVERVSPGAGGTTVRLFDRTDARGDPEGACPRVPGVSLASFHCETR